MTRVAVTGAAGLLGRATCRAFRDAGADVTALTHSELEITDADQTLAALAGLGPSIVVHCAALTDVDACEREPAKAWTVNAAGSGNVARAAAECDAAVIDVSTDYVFDGRRGGYSETDATNPIQHYGRSKLGGEQLAAQANPRHFIVRSAWIYGSGGKNFASRLREFAASGRVRAVADQRSSPTYAPDLARAIVELARTDAYGLYHLVNEGACSWAELARHILREGGAAAEVEDIPASALARPAPRPDDTSLVAGAWRKLGREPLRPWQNAASDFARVLFAAGTPQVT